MKEKELINDKRLTPTMTRVRSGSKQLFRERNPEDRSFISEDNCDVVLTHEDKAMYAELIDEEWYWVSGCAECNGKERDWMSYVECEKHDVCRSCGTSRKDITEIPWGGKHGWQCQPCHKQEKKANKKSALKEFKEKKLGPNNFLYMSEIRCPYCNSKTDSGDIYESCDIECYVCEKEFSLEIEYTPSYSTSKK